MGSENIPIHMNDQATGEAKSAPTSTEASSKKKRERSPAYPAISLRESIERVQTLWQNEKRNAVPISVAASHWDYAAKSSGAFQTISALKQYGLLTDEGIGDKRNVRLSDPLSTYYAKRPIRKRGLRISELRRSNLPFMQNCGGSLAPKLPIRTFRPT